MATRGIDIRQSSDRIILRASLKDSSGAKVTSGTTEMRVYRLEDDGTLDVLDWDAGVQDFVSSGATDDEVTMTHRQADGVDTGIWTYAITDADILAAFDSGQVYIAQVTNSVASPESQEREFQFGGVEGDQVTDGSFTAVTVQATTVGQAPTVNIERQQYEAFGSQTITAETSQAGDSHVMMFYLPEAPKTAVWKYTTDAGEIAVGGSGSLDITITANDDRLDTAGTWLYKLWNVTDDACVCRGSLTVIEGPDPDEVIV